MIEPCHRAETSRFSRKNADFFLQLYHMNERDVILLIDIALSAKHCDVILWYSTGKNFGFFRALRAQQFQQCEEKRTSGSNEHYLLLKKALKITRKVSLRLAKPCDTHGNVLLSTLCTEYTNFKDHYTLIEDKHYVR